MLHNRGTVDCEQNFWEKKSRELLQNFKVNKTKNGKQLERKIKNAGRMEEESIIKLCGNIWKVCEYSLDHSPLFSRPKWR